MMYVNFYGLFKLIKEALGLIGVAIIVAGAAYSVFKLRTVRGPGGYKDIREGFACFIVLGLEFMLASDLIMTIMAPDYYTLGILGGLVIIRTIMTFSLDREAAQIGKK